MAAGGRKKPLDKRDKLKRFVWCWTLAIVLAGVLSFLASIYVNFTEFRDSAFGARDERSLLLSNPTTGASNRVVSLGPIISLGFVAATPTSTALPSKVQKTVTAEPAITPLPVGGDLPATPTIVPTPTSAPTPLPVIAPTSTPAPATTAPPALPSAASTIMEKIQRGERISLLVLGYDGPGYNGPYLSDTILEIVYDPAKKVVSMINIPRDLYVFIPYGENGSGEWGKVNQAFSKVMNLGSSNSLARRYQFSSNNNNSKTDAAAILAKDTVEQITGIPVDFWMTVNFAGFRGLVDAIGGVTVNVEKAFDDHEYSTNPGLNDGRNYLHFDAGVQKMNGLRALNYARSRNSLQDNGDLGRSRRQMRLVQAIKEQVLHPDILLKIPAITDALRGNIRTSLTFDDTIALVNFFNGSQGQDATSNIRFVSELVGQDFLDSTSNEAGFVFIPKAGKGNYSAIQQWLQNALNSPQSQAVTGQY